MSARYIYTYTWFSTLSATDNYYDMARHNTNYCAEGFAQLHAFIIIIDTNQEEAPEGEP